ncbi:hypothetical protein NDU88_003987 [Pleurodeles waltl]|uniref:Uncharacterized protein n=1 Tax=Pleurodeles waltl TaxID=8319 RepID=A0AAV7NLF5_PLEWA|nr:hypothetical protein NDU88_003987 [Pleurodeles waltl]
MHLGAEQQPPTAPATEAARPAFPASRAVFRGCFSPASSGRHRLAAAAANRVPDVHLALALVVSSRDASHPSPASTSVVCRTPLSSSLSVDMHCGVLPWNKTAVYSTTGVSLEVMLQWR